MNKKTIGMFAASLLMSIGTAGMTALAAEGWAQENGRFVYYSASGSKVSDAWRTGTDGKWRYLDSSGYMAVSTWVDNEEYYVDGSGIMLANQWLKAEDSSKEGGYSYYYLGDSGKMVRGKWISYDNKKYHLDDDGVMETGWILDDEYYCDASGAMLTGWQRLYPPNADEDESDRDSSSVPYYDNYSDDGKEWFYFSPSGRKAVSNGSDEVSTKKINGATYMLDSNGAARFGWVCINGDSSDRITDYRLTDANGQVMKGWYSAYVPEALRGSYEYDVEWFYFNNNGLPQTGPMKGDAAVKDLKRIGGYTYLFDEDGVPVYGLQRIRTGEDRYTAYYFGNVNQRSMMKGKFRIGDDHYYFSNTGKGYTGVYENYLYYMGKLQKADSASRYEVFSVPNETGSGFKNYVVNASGRIVKNSTVKDANGTKYKVGSSGILLKEDGESVDGNTYSTPDEPDWEL